MMNFGSGAQREYYNGKESRKEFRNFHESERVALERVLAHPISSVVDVGCLNGDAIENNAYRLEEKYRRHWIGMLLSGDWISILEPQIPGR